MKFDYCITTVADAQLDVSDMGNVCIEANNLRGEYYYLLIKTDLGWTEILEYGPIVPDVKLLPTSVICNYSRIEYSEYKLDKLITKFLNDGKRSIAQALVIDADDAKKVMRNLVESV